MASWVALVAMLESLWPAWLALWAAWIAQAVLSLMLVRKFARRRLPRRPRSHHEAHRPHAVVIVPFKGAADDIGAAVDALCRQQHDDYRLLCLVERSDDPAYPLLRQHLARHPQCRSEIFVTGRAPDHQGQKVHNQLVALGRVEPDCDDEDVWVFADSDAHPPPHWLGKMIGPLCEARIGVSTGYRWLIPQPGAALWTHFASVMNSSVTCFLGIRRLNRAWGGSMAIRVGTARTVDLKGWLRGALCDDYQFSRMCRAHALGIAFVPECLIPSPVSFTRRTMLNFMHRQHLLTRVYAPQLFWAGLGITGLYVLAGLSAWAVLAWELFRDPAAARWLAPLSVLLTVAGLNVMRSHYRRHAVRFALGDDAERRLRPTLALDRWGTSAVIALHFLLLLRTLLGRRMVWRGVTYLLDAPQVVRRLRPQ